MKKETIEISKASIKIDSCGLSYKGKELEMGTPIEDWIKVLGQPDRKFIAYMEKDKGTYVWDKLGIAVDNFENGDGTVAWMYIFFLNLNSPEAEQQMLNHARSWEKFDEKKYRNGRIPMSEEMINEVKEKLAPKNYIYPFNVYQGAVDLNGFPVQAGMKVEEINAYRKDLPYSGQFGYVDDDIDGVNDSGVTTKTFGGDYRAPGAECKDGRLQYYELTYTATKKLEYLKIGYESKSDFDSRKVMEASFEERKKNGQ
ncbi:hypothetical protein ACM46_10060 [Chryseobacterium angstadtii]|uniref:DUF7738 domain-containing protein n=1 Tax=Chryseobacterium angstadtii TaxID=558151 RepID=A0A0J7IFA1_9FLAO|nr:hypothetical protein [Chryseobacterium angstadtii]KMQ64591.1 hypothetical protein ACM46_10060 [Chryseobacterium angstadtii]